MVRVCIISFSLAIFAVLQTIESQNLTKAKCDEYNRIYLAYHGDNDILPLIVGGSKTNDAEFPFMALIGFGKNNTVWHCGGTLISEKYVLSAAHCVNSKEYGNAYKIKFGMSKQSEKNINVQERKIVDVISNPGYKRPQKYNDIAIFVLDAPVRITPFVIPGCLNHNKDFMNENTEAVAIGFGKTSFDDEDGSEDLLKVDLPIHNNSICDPFYKSMRKTTLRRGLTNDMICAGDLNGGKDTCQGDSGGPLVVLGEHPTVVGVTSFGKFCGYAKSPAIYMKVYNYLPWIEKIAWSK